MKPRVYIAGPYRSNPIRGTANAIEAGDDLAHLGVIPFVPHLTIVWDAWRPNPERFYLDLDMEWLEVCDALYRLPGQSSGADAEVRRMLDLGRPVFFRVAALLTWADLWRAGRFDEAELFAAGHLIAFALETSGRGSYVVGHAGSTPIYAYFESYTAYAEERVRESEEGATAWATRWISAGEWP